MRSNDTNGSLPAAEQPDFKKFIASLPPGERWFVRLHLWGWWFAYVSCWVAITAVAVGVAK